jgi:hypothetical protein
MGTYFDIVGGVPALQTSWEFIDLMPLMNTSACRWPAWWRTGLKIPSAWNCLD